LSKVYIPTFQNTPWWRS